MSLTISSGRSFRYASKPVFADSATSTLAPHSSSIARMTSRVSSSSSTTSTVVPSSSMGDGCTPPGAPAIWGIFFRRPGYARRNEDALTRSSASPPRFRCRKGSGILFAKARGRRCSMKAFVVLLTVAFVLVAHVVAVAGPGDPRLVNGVLEWPRTVTNEPFLVVRGDDGVLYHVGIAAARRDGPLAGGARVSVLGLEGRTANEITALGVGAGETTEAALAHLQGARPAPAASAPVVATPPAVVPATAPTGPPPPSAAAAPAAAPVATGPVPASPSAPPATTVTPPAPRGAPAPAVAPPAPPVTPPGM